MRKTAIFVEGNTELVFVRECLCKQFGYEILEIECRKRQFKRFDNVPFSISNPDAKLHFRIIDSGSDARVLDDILEDENLLVNLGYHKIIGLRDMYSENYLKEIKHQRKVNPELNQKFIDRFNARINREAKNPEQIYFHFAIMELEAWFLGIPKLWERKGISNQSIKEKLKFDLSEIDPEITFLHPTETLKDILKIINESYRKQASEVESLVSYIEKQDFEDLQNSQKCNSFKEFTANLTVN